MSSAAQPASGVSVVLPVHNNADTLAEMCVRLRAAIPDRQLQIIMVDDASVDTSLDVMRGLQAETVALPENRGQNAAILAGLARARQPVVCVLDADLQDPPEAVPRLVAGLDARGASVVFATRNAPFRFSSTLFRRVLRALFPSLPPWPCLCFALDDAARRQVLAVASEHDYLPAVIGSLRLPTAAVTVRREARGSRRSGYPGLARLRHGALMLASALRLRMRKPLRDQPARRARNDR